MSQLLRALLAALIALVLGFVTPATVVAASTPSSVSYAYECQHRCAWSTHAASVRGPPAPSPPTAAGDVVDLGSCGLSLRMRGATPCAAITYDGQSVLARFARDTTTTLEPARGADGEFLAVDRVGVAANTGTALVKYDADFALGQSTAGGRATASQLDEFGSLQGWARSQTATGPVKFTDGNGVVRLTIKQGSPRAPGSGGPHVELRNPDGIRIDPFGNPVSRTSPGNHTPIVWDW